MLIFLTQNVWALPSCEELEKDLLKLEYEMQNSYLPDCSKTKQTFCKPDGTTSSTLANSSGQKSAQQKSYSEILEDYNKAMAKLIIAEGIKTINAAIEGSHNSLVALDSVKALEEADINKSKSYMNILESNLEKSLILEAAMTPVSGGEIDGQNIGITSFWHKYQFRPDDDEDKFKEKIKSACVKENKIIDDTPLCNKLFTIEKEDKEKIKTYEVITDSNQIEENDQIQSRIEMLYGFALAEMRDRPSMQQDPEGYYDKMKEKLMISNGVDKDALSPSDFKEKYFGDGGLHSSLKKAITAYEENKTEDNAKKIYEIARNLDPIEVNYEGLSSNLDKLSDNHNQMSSPLDFMSAVIKKPLATLDVDITDNIITDVWKINTKTQSEKITNQSKTLEKGLELDAKDILESIPSVSCTNKTDAVACLKEMCGIDESNKQYTCNNSEIQQISKGHFENTIAKIKALKNFDANMQNALACYQEKTLDKKRSCLEQKKIDLMGADQKSTITQLQEKVKEAKDSIIAFNNAKPFKDLNMEKALALQALQKKNCLQSDRFEAVEYTCKQDLGGVADEQAMSLSNDLADISIYLEKDLLAVATGKVAAGSEQNAELVRRRNEYMEDCNPKNNICAYYHAEAERRRAQLARQAEMTAQAKIKQQNRLAMKKQEKSAGSSFLKGFGQGMIASTPYLASEWARYDSTKTWHKQQMNQIADMEKAYDRRIAYYDWLKENGWSNSSTGYYGSNWGANNYWDAYSYNSNFQGYNSYNVYNDTTNAFQFNFSGPPLPTASTYTPTTTNPGFTSSQSYEFSF